MKYFFALLFVVIGHCSFGQNFQSELTRHIRAGDTLKQRETLEKWEKENPNNPDLYIHYFNYFLNKAKNELTSFALQQSQEFETKSMSNAEEISNNTENPFVLNYEKYVGQAFDKIEGGINLYPNRLDMRLGKIYVLAQNENWTEYTNEIVKAIRHSNTNNNLWTWTNNEELPGGKGFFLSSLRSYQSDLFKLGEDSLLLNIRTISNEILKYYPTNTESLSNISLTYVLTNDYDRGLDYLFAAEKINPKDIEVLSNIAQVYIMRGENSKAIKYYKKVMKQVDKETAQSLQKEIDALKK